MVLKRKPELVNCLAGETPKKDSNQSPLQIAIKTEKFDIAKMLIEQGGNVNFMENPKDFEWSKPVIHFAISAVTLNSRFPIYIPKYSKKTKQDSLAFSKKIP